MVLPGSVRVKLEEEWKLLIWEMFYLMNPSKMVLILYEEKKIIFTLPVVSKLHNQRRVLNQLSVLMNTEYF
jgi:hypothetical protein